MRHHILRHKEKYVAAFAILLMGTLVLWYPKYDTEKLVEPEEEAVPEIAQTIPTSIGDGSSVTRDFMAEESDFVPPPAIDMNRMKREGCITDRLLTEGFPEQGRAIQTVNRSGCYYLHRAVETWLEPPDWDEVDREMEKLRDGFVIGMFIAEAIDVKDEYYYPDENRDFDFRAMCRPGSKNVWGEHTCTPYIGREEYRDYVRYIMYEGMRRGIQVFMFGQVHLQEDGNLEDSRLPELLDDMRRTADHMGIDILIGAQTNDIDREDYLHLFDFIEGGVGISPEGEIEDGPCFSRWWKKEGDWCWALLWHEHFANRAENVFVHYDWSGRIGDDMSTITRMDPSMRQKTTAQLHRYFTKRDIGFLLPFLTPLPEGNDGCTGASEHFYSADSRYSCDDEDAWNDILSGNGYRMLTR